MKSFVEPKSQLIVQARICALSDNFELIHGARDGTVYGSADDLRINLWNLGVTDTCFNIVDIKPSNMEELTEV